MQLIKSKALDYYQKTIEALKWVSYDLYLDQVVDLIEQHLNENNPDFWNIHVALCYLSKILSPKTYLEIGTRRGRSLFQVLVHAHVQRVVTIDLYQESHFLDLKQDVEAFLQKTRKDVEIVFYKERSEEAFQKIQEKFDLITIDGSHYLEVASKDLESSYKRLNDRGCIVVDDVAQMPYLLGMIEEFLKDKPELKCLHTDQLYGCAVIYRGIEL